ncbi:unnamed protein product [Phytophthora fragariaefolia]|uniref:Unnamed protein product n=1 Tax=Phytophthora fragariaefolia TaxID=1490495 RepID=A0A9W7CU25_9STRA|nr:unnamed protein product [Phytophthora fragariaefolia]
MAAAVTPVCALFYFMTPGLWDDTATASEDYFVEKIDERVNEQYQKQVAREQKKPGYRRQTREQIRVKLEQTPPITGRDLCVFIGLLVARTISPNKEKLQHHWKTTDEGAIPRGCFGRFMTRDRFAHVSRNLHFSSNTDPRAATDRAWKLRPVIEALQETFRAGYMPPPVMAFDEAMFPSRSSFNIMRVFEVYLGKAGSADGVALRDERTGPVSVVRNLRAAFGDGPFPEKRLIVIDRFYTSVPLTMQLWTMGYYSVGTVQTNRKGLAAQIVPPKKAKKKEQSRPAGIERGTLTYAESSLVPRMRTTKWWDNRPVYLLSIGGSTEVDRIVRRAKSGVQEEVVCPRIVKDYQTFMGRVDHMPIQTVDTRRGNTDGVKKRRQRACKVCSVLKEKVTGGDTSFQCSACKLKTIDQKTGELKESPVYLCNKVKHSFDGQARTYFEIWHTCWRNGTFKPSRGKRKLRVRVTEDGEAAATDDEGTPQPQRHRVVMTTSS